MPEKVVTFTGPNEMNPVHQRKVIDLLFMELDLEIVHIKDNVYKIRKRTAPTNESPSKSRATKATREKGAKTPMRTASQKRTKRQK